MKTKSFIASTLVCTSLLGCLGFSKWTNKHGTCF